MTIETRGSWNLHRAIVSRWRESGLDAAFREEWSDASISQYEVLHDEEAQPVPPGPYCVFAIGISPLVVASMGGTEADGSDRRQVVSYQLSFTVHAKSDTTRSGKDRARILAEKVAAAFDPGTQPLDVSPDCHLETRRIADYSMRGDRDEWSWVLAYEVHLDVAYARRST